MITVEFLVTSLIIVLIPGTGVIFTVSTGLTKGRRASFYAALGCTAGIVPHLAATILGLAAVMHTSAVAFQTLKYSGVCYLLYLAYATWKDHSRITFEDAFSRQGALSLVGKAILLNLLNPKLTLFFLAFLPQFVVPGESSLLSQLFLLSGLFMGMTLGIFIVYGLLAHAFRKAVIDSPTAQGYLRRGIAAAFAGLGVRLALAKP
ncbi:MAG: lysine transporter LysE [Desulfuromonas sp.]|nr:MAG: lysine transporter LysE [Desulfuromonas sp.]